MVNMTDLKRKSSVMDVTQRKRQRNSKNNSQAMKNNGADSTSTYLKDHFCEDTLRTVESMAQIQVIKSHIPIIRSILEGRNLVATVNPGRFTTLAFLIPVIEYLKRINIKNNGGTRCIIISATRESALQVIEILKDLLKNHPYTCASLTEGSDRKTEARKLATSPHIIVATLKRLFYHLQNTPAFIHKNIKSLTLAEAERIIEIGSKETLKQLIKILPKERQTVLFLKEADNIDKIVDLIMMENPVYINTKEKLEAIRGGFEIGYIFAPSEKRFHFLYSFLEKNKKKKVIVFFNSCMSAKYHHELLTAFDIPALSIHSKQKQIKQDKIFSKFCNATSGILLCAEAAVRNFQFTEVDWIVQFDPPENPKDYIERSGDFLRGVKNRGKMLLILRPEEIAFLSYLKESEVSVNEFKVSWNKIRNLQLSLEKLVSRNYFMYLSASEAFKAYTRAYDSHYLKEYFDIGNLDLTKVANSFGLTVPPAIDLSITKTEVDRITQTEKRRGGGGYGYFKEVNFGGKSKNKVRTFKQIVKRKNIRKVSI